MQSCIHRSDDACFWNVQPAAATCASSSPMNRLLVAPRSTAYTCSARSRWFGTIHGATRTTPFSTSVGPAPLTSVNVIVISPSKSVPA